MCQKTANPMRRRSTVSTRSVALSKVRKMEIEFHAGILYLAYELTQTMNAPERLPIPHFMLHCQTAGEELRRLADLSDKIRVAQCGGGGVEDKDGNEIPPELAFPGAYRSSTTVN